MSTSARFYGLPAPAGTEFPFVKFTQPFLRAFTKPVTPGYADIVLETVREITGYAAARRGRHLPTPAFD